MNQLTRRQLLAAVGVAGVGTGLAGAGLARATARDPPYTRYTYAQAGDTDERRLRVAWYETYNGQFVDSTDGTGDPDTVLDPAAEPTYVNDPGPVIQVAGALPGDSGQLVVGLEADEVDTDNEGVDVWLRLSLNADLENGVNEPESLAAGEDDPLGPASGDDTGTGTGELGEAVQVRLWKDGGFGGVNACNGGSPDINETVLANDSLAGVAATSDLADGARIVDCLAQGATRCVSLTWEIPRDAGNQLQGDSVDFDIEFVGQSCGGSDPFAANGGTQ
jgi:hypothetical protein